MYPPQTSITDSMHWIRQAIVEMRPSHAKAARMLLGFGGWMERTRAIISRGSEDDRIAQAWGIGTREMSDLMGMLEKQACSESDEQRGFNTRLWKMESACYGPGDHQYHYTMLPYHPDLTVCITLKPQDETAEICTYRADRTGKIVWENTSPMPWAEANRIVRSIRIEDRYAMDVAEEGLDQP